MKIGRLYTFEAAHVVRNCASKRCKYSIHGHSYKLEIILSAAGLDNAQMIYDFGFMKREIAAIIDSFDHSTIIYSGDDESYKNAIKSCSQRWVELPFNASCEQISRVIFAFVNAILEQTTMQNGENSVFLDSIKLNETAKGWAIFERADLALMPVELDKIKFSEEIMLENAFIFEKLKNKEKFINPKEV